MNNILCFADLHEFCSGDRCQCPHHSENSVRGAGASRERLLIMISYECWHSFPGLIKTEEELSSVIFTAAQAVGVTPTQDEVNTLVNIVSEMSTRDYPYWSHSEVQDALATVSV